MRVYQFRHVGTAANATVAEPMRIMRIRSQFH